MSNINQETLTALLQGKLAFKVYNKETSEWEVLKVFNPELETHAGAKATTTEPGHVMLVTDLESESEELAATAKALSTVFKAVETHVNEEGSHLTAGQTVLIDQIPSLVERIKALEEALLTNQPEPTE